MIQLSTYFMNFEYHKYRKTRQIVTMYVTLLICVISFIHSCEMNEGTFAPLNVIEDESGSIFDDFTVKELIKIREFIYKQEEFALRSSEIRYNDPEIFMMETLPPTKSEALAYLDNAGPKPEKYAKVIIYRADLKPRVIMEYKVGPVGGHMTREVLREIGWNNHVPIWYVQMKYIEKNVTDAMASIDHLILQVTGHSFKNCTNNCLQWRVGDGSGTSEDPSANRLWTQFLEDTEGYFLHPIGLQIRIDLDSWVIDKLWWRGEYFDDIEDLRLFLVNYISAPENTLFEENKNQDIYSSLKTRNPYPEETTKKGPTTTMPDGRRYSVDGHNVLWQGWTFDFNIRTITGVQLHDVKFNGQRILYELGVQEFAVFYSGYDPLSAHTSYFDSAWGLGKFTFELLPGVDCPKYADYFDFANFGYSTVNIWNNSACLFEVNNGVPIRRHYMSDYKGGYSFAQGMADNTLILRTVVTEMNYDYLIDFVFHQNGVLEVRWSLTGYILTSYKVPNANEPKRFGNDVAPNVFGNLHHHAANFKVDMDIDGTKNRFQTLEIKGEKVQDETIPDNDLWRLYYTASLKETEQDALYKYNFDKPKYLIFYNNDSLNDLGNPKGYRLVSQSMAKMVFDDEYYDQMKSSAWTRYQVAVTRYKDNEQCSNSPYANTNPYDPVVDFQSYIDDNENIVDQDLVAWVTLGAHHIPSPEDVPITSTIGLQESFFLKPFNYFPEDQSMRSVDNIRSTPDPNMHGKHRYEYAYKAVNTSGAQSLRFRITSFCIMILITLYLI